MSHVRTLEQVIRQVRIPFRPKHDPNRNLAEEIESCKRKIWECVNPAERQQYLEKKQKKTEVQDEKIQNDKENSSSSANSKRVSASGEVEKTIKVVQKPQEAKAQAPATRTDIELKVFVMKVVELKKELKSRGEDTGGLKKDLRARLVSVMLEQSEQQQAQAVDKQNVIPAPDTAVELNVEPNENSTSMEVSKMSEDEKLEEATPTSPPKNKLSIKPQEERKKSGTSMRVEQQVQEVEMKNEPNDVNGESFTKLPASVKKSVKKPESSLTAINELVPTSSSMNSLPVSKKSDEKSPLTETNVKEFSESHKTNDLRDDVSGPASEASFSSMASGTSVKDMVSKFSGFSSTLPTSNGSALSKGLQAKKEAREARIAEMRAKAQTKPVTSTKVALTSKEYSNTLSSLNATVSAGSVKKNNLASQMREKAAARAFQNKITSSTPTTTSSNKRLLPLTNNSNHSNTNAPDLLGATLKQAPSIKKPLKAMSPMDTYEISDREDSETDDSDSDSDNEKSKKKIPVWAQKQNLYPALEEQYNGRVDGKKVDPDDIFPEVHSCDLEAIFGNKKKNYRSRASSGNWAKDKVTSAEKRVYKREMGFTNGNNDANIDPVGV